jgi:hypothetical protein
MKTRNILRKLQSELARLIYKGVISEKTAKTYKSIAEKILKSRYLDKTYSEGHLRRINRVLSLLNKVFNIAKKTAHGLSYKVSGLFYCPELKQAFGSFSELVIEKRKRERADIFLRQLFDLFETKLNPFTA